MAEQNWNLDSLTPKQDAFSTARPPSSSDSQALRLLLPDPEIQIWEGNEKEEDFIDKWSGMRHTGTNRIWLACLFTL